MRSPYRLSQFASLACALALTAAAAACGDDPEPTAAESSEENYSQGSSTTSAPLIYSVELEALNNSGVSGTASLTLDGDQLTVAIQATGLEAPQLHLKHIHGDAENKRNATCPPASADANGNGLVEFAEGLPFYGPVLLDLQSFTTTDGTLDFVQTFTVETSALGPLQNRVIVLHGLTVDGVYSLSLPVACGQIRPTRRG